jgi:chromosome segregation ATPase
MEKLIREAAERSKQIRAEYNQAIDQLLGEKQELQMALRGKQDQLNDSDAKIANLQFTIQQFQNQVQGLERKIAELGTVSKYAKTQEMKLEDYDKKIHETIKNFEAKLKELNSLIDGLEKQKSVLQGDVNKGQQ